MGKTDFSKAEKGIAESVQKMRIQSLVEGKTVTSQRSKEFYALEGEDVRPVPQDPVLVMLSEEAAKEELAAGGQKVPSDEEEEFLMTINARMLLHDVMIKLKPQSARMPQRPQPKLSDIAPSERYLERASALYTLRQHILWLKVHNITNRYQLLGSTLEEVLTYRSATKLTDEELKRIKELNKRAEALIAQLLKKEHMGSNQELIQEQIKKHKTKRLNVKDSWLAL